MGNLCKALGDLVETKELEKMFKSGEIEQFLNTTKQSGTRSLIHQPCQNTP